MKVSVTMELATERARRDVEIELAPSRRMKA